MDMNNLKISDSVRLRRTIDVLTPVTRARLHATSICDGCDEFIVGPRFRCIDCSDFDFCYFCLNTQSTHNHPFLMFHHALPSAVKTVEFTNLVKTAMCKCAQTASPITTTTKKAATVFCQSCSNNKPCRFICLSCRAETGAMRVYCDGCELFHDEHHVRLWLPQKFDATFGASLSQVLPTIEPLCLCAEGVSLAVPQPVHARLGTAIADRSPSRTPPVFEVVPMSHEHLQKVTDIDATCFSAPWPFEQFEALSVGHRGRSFAFVAVTKVDQDATEESSVEVAGAIVASTGRGKVGSVQSIAVFPTFRRMGVASRLLRAVADECFKNRQLDALKLQVSKNNLPARRLYERLGFIKDCELIGYYQATDGPDSGDAIVMIAKLPLVDR